MRIDQLKENSNTLNFDGKKRRKVAHHAIEEDVDDCIASEGENNDRYKYSSAKKWRKGHSHLRREHSPKRASPIRTKLNFDDNLDDHSSIFAGKE